MQTPATAAHWCKSPHIVVPYVTIYVTNRLAKQGGENGSRRETTRTSRSCRVARLGPVVARDCADTGCGNHATRSLQALMSLLVDWIRDSLYGKSDFVTVGRLAPRILSLYLKPDFLHIAGRYISWGVRFCRKGARNFGLFQYLDYKFCRSNQVEGA